MADEKVLNPAPAVPEGEYPELSPNPNFTGENEKGSDQAENMHPSYDGELPERHGHITAKSVNTRKLFVKGKDIKDYIDSEGGVTEAEMEEYVESVLGDKIKYGNYIYSEDGFIRVDEVPDDYSGAAITIGDDGYNYIDSYHEGDVADEVEISPHNGVVVYGYEADKLAVYDTFGASKVNPSAITGLTHSFDELDATLQGIIQDAIAGAGNGVACTQEQWNAIRALLDESLYIVCNGYSMIKTVIDRTVQYKFGDLSGTNAGSSLLLTYDPNQLLLEGFFVEI